MPEDPLCRVVATDHKARDVVSGPDNAEDEPRQKSAIALLQWVERIARKTQLLRKSHEEDRAVAKKADQRKRRRGDVGASLPQNPIVDETKAGIDEQDRQKPYSWS